MMDNNNNNNNDDADEEKTILLPPLQRGSGGGKQQQQQHDQSASTSPSTGSWVPSPSPADKGTVTPDYSSTTSPTTLTTSKSLSSNWDDDLPTNISTIKQLKHIPSACLSTNKSRPLRHVNEKGDVTTYALRPMFYSVIFILLIELLERFSFYGVQYTQTSFLTGVYDDEWNAGMTSVGASTYVSISTAVAYTMPFVGAILADSIFGDYWSILVGAIVLYIPGLVLITMSTVPGLLGETFNKQLLALGLLVLWPTGTGVVKSIVNVFGAKQFHPLLQSSLIESYYVNFYMCINIGALIGGIVVPIVAQYDITLAYSFPVAMLCIGVVLFVLGTSRYVRHKPSGDLFSKHKTKAANVVNTDDVGLQAVFRISILIIPFNIAYSQMATTFIVQGNVMSKAFGFIDAASMNNADAISVLFFGYVIGAHLYPSLAERNIKIPTTYKFAIGSGLGSLAIAWALVMEHKIRSTYATTGGHVNIMWQSVAYILIGCGEIFAVSAAYEAAFTASPPEQKVLASAMNLFCVGGIPNVLCIFLYQACRGWFNNSRGKAKINHIEDYASAHTNYYFWVLLGISLLGVIVNLLPSVRDFVQGIEDKATDMVKTPVMKKPTRRRRRKFESSASTTDYSSDDDDDDDDDDEASPMLRVKRHEAYLKYGSGPVLYKQGSMRAGPFNNRILQNKKGKKSPKHKLKKGQVGQLYRTHPKKAVVVPKVVLGSDGKPLTAGSIHHKKPRTMKKSHSFGENK